MTDVQNYKENKDDFRNIEDFLQKSGKEKIQLFNSNNELKVINNG